MSDAVTGGGAQNGVSNDDRQAVERRARFVDSIPQPLLSAEDALSAALAIANTSARSKLRRIYRLADELGELRAPFVACAKGCSACCHMNVSITAAEAELLSVATGRRAKRFSAAPRHRPDEFVGRPCPFLKGGDCSVYDDRPLTCRKHSSFYTDAARCQPELMNSVQVPQLSFSGLDQALFDASSTRRGVMLADIRDFFPPPDLAGEPS